MVQSANRKTPPGIAS
ncbi:hypothetical protein AYI68_g5490, partial [Smittium mucronatum]